MGTNREIKEWGDIRLRLSLSVPVQTNFLLNIDGGVITDHLRRPVFSAAVIEGPIKTRILYNGNSASAGQRM